MNSRIFSKEWMGKNLIEIMRCRMVAGFSIFISWMKPHSTYVPTNQASYFSLLNASFWMVVKGCGRKRKIQTHILQQIWRRKQRISRMDIQKRFCTLYMELKIRRWCRWGREGYRELKQNPLHLHRLNRG